MQKHFLKRYLDISKLLTLIIWAAFTNASLGAQITKNYTLKWSNFDTYSLNNETYNNFITFGSAYYNSAKTGGLPIFSSSTLLVNSISSATIEIRNAQYETISAIQSQALLENQITIKQLIGIEKKQTVCTFSFIPVQKNSLTGSIERLLSFDIVINYNIAPNIQSFSKKASADNSVLSKGVWLKLAVNQTGVHSLTKSFLRTAGLDIDNIDPRTIKIYGYGAGMLPQLNSVNRYDDLPENSILVEGESDGKFNDNDAVLFYAKAQNDVWQYSTPTSVYSHQTNIYSDITYYFLTYGGLPGKRILDVAPVGIENITVNQFDKLYVYEKELTNLIKSGRKWMGEEFSRVNTASFAVNMGSINTAEPIYFKSQVVARSFSSSTFGISANGNPLANVPINAVDADFEKPYASENGVTTNFTASSPNITIGYQYNYLSAGSVGWLDYFEIVSRNFLNQISPQFTFRDSKSIGFGNISKFNITSNIPITVWNITNPTSTVKMQVSFANNNASFITTTDSLKEFISFTGQQYLTPISAILILNQNLHALAQADLLIITHNAFLVQAQQLANFHTSKSLLVNVVTTDQIYNEFSSGTPDLSAIRDFIRMFYKRATNPQNAPKYVTLLGRASYDYKDRIANNTNFVPTYESLESYAPVGTYNSDDYIGFLDDNEGTWDSNGDTKEFADVAIGRLPAQDQIQAQQMIDKIIKYLNSPEFGDWKTKLAFVADDEDSNTHINQSDNLANYSIANFKDYNVKKIFIDAYNEVNTSGGARNPEAQAEIIRTVEQGAMLINYTGHGGEIGWAAERILNTDDIQGWTNGNKLPLFVTATCEFSRFDDPSRTSAGEMVLLNPNGGGIALFTTVRLVSSGSNFNLNTILLNNIGMDSVSAFNRKPFGEIMRLTKNSYLGGDKNERNFTLLGDPAMFLAYPTNRVVTTSINNQSLSNTIPDTLKAFAKITIGGKITTIQNSDLANFNGVIYPTVYDKPSTYKTIGNNPTSISRSFTMQNNVIYRGKASVKNGQFSFSFIVPKDISYEIGFGKISYESDNGATDAAGNYQKIIVGNTSDTIPTDNIGPDIKLYLNDEKFVYGGVTNENPTLIMKLRDENGINITGRGVGRDLSVILNNNVSNTVSLNDYYKAKLDSYQEGEVRFLMKDLPQGKNLLKTKAFDIYNNSSDAMLEFIVATSQQVALQHVLNYPNPFTTNTTFHFDHNKAGETITVQIQIFTISGKLIKTLQTETATIGNHFDQLNWDGRDDYGDNIGKGVYIYKVRVKAIGGKTAEEYQKLVILN